MNDSLPAGGVDLELLVAEVVDEISERLQRGEEPTIDEYVARHPELADVLPALMKSLKAMRSPSFAGISGGVAPSVPIPTTGCLGDFRLIRQVGQGGMGNVYEAEQISLGRRVALKVLPFAAALDAKQLQRFKNEAQAAACLHHQHVVPVYAVGCERGVHYYAMQFIEGQTLAATIHELRAVEQGVRDSSRSGHVETESAQTPAVANLSTLRSVRDHEHFRTVAQLGAQAADALEHAHELGVIHRDVKPANLMLDVTGHLWITDFGLARLHSGDGLTMTGDLLGTLRYLSPEQAQGNPLLLDHRTDLYSLGASLYELLTLEPVFSADNRAELLRKIADEEPLPPSRINRAVPPELETIVLKLLSKSAADRYATARATAEDLRRFLNNETIKARRPTILQRMRKWARRHRPIVWSGIVSTVLLMIMAIGALAVSNRLIHTEKENALDEKSKAQNAERLAKRAERQAKQRLFEARLAEARASRYSRKVGQRFESWDAIAEAARLARELQLHEARFRELRNEAIACLALTDLRRLKQWNAWPSGSRSDWTIDGDFKHYARGNLKGDISVRRLADDREVVLLPGDGPGKGQSGVADVRFSPDGRRLAVRYWHALPGRSTNFLLWDWKKKHVVLEPSFSLSEPAFAFSADSRHLAVGHSDGTITIHDTANGNERGRLGKGTTPYHLAYHPNGGTLAVAGFKKVELRDAATGRTLQTFAAPNRVWEVAWHPNGALVAGGCTGASVMLWDAATGKQFKALRGHQGTVVRVGFASDGALLTAAWDGTCRLWNPWTGRETLRLHSGEGFFSNDGRRMVTALGYNLTLWERAPGLEYRTLPKRVGVMESGVAGGEFSPDGRWLVMPTGHGVRIWDVATFTESKFLPLGRTDGAVFDRQRGKLFTSGAQGLFEWSWRNRKGVLRIGDARRVPMTSTPGRISIDPKGRVLAVQTAGGNGWILDLNGSPWKGRRYEHHEAVSIAVSPDGRWVATGTHNGFGVKLWDARTGTITRELMPEERYGRVSFSADGRRLAVSGTDGYHVWQLEPWQLEWTIHREGQGGAAVAAAFAADGRVMAICHSLAAIQFVDPATGNALVNLEAPDSDRIGWLGLSPDGGHLAVTTQAHVVHVWDLRRIRKQLRQIGLDWNLPAHPPPPAPTDVRIETDLSSFQRCLQAQQVRRRGLSLTKAKRWDEAEAAFTEAIKLDPALFDAHHQRGHVHEATSKWQKAIDDFTVAIDGKAGVHGPIQTKAVFAHLHFVRGQAHLKLKNHVEAIGDMTRVLELSPRWRAAHYYRADAQAELGNWQEAEADFAKVKTASITNALVDYKRGLLLLALDNEQGHQDVCKQLIELTETRPAAVDAAWAAWTSALSARSGVGSATMVRLAERALKSVPGDPDKLTALGAALYRSERFAEAIERLKEAEAAYARSPNAYGTKTFTWLFRAMAHHRLGQREEARHWLTKASKAIDASNGKKEKWDRRLTFRIVRKEAENLLSK